MSKTTCIKCGIKLRIGDFAHNQEICFDCFTKEVNIIMARIDQYPPWFWNKREEHKDIVQWMLASVAEIYGRKIQKKTEARTMANLQREVWEGWTPQAFIDALSEEIRMIMTGESWRKSFTTREELVKYIVDHQPYYKKSIPEVNDYFANLYGLK